MATYALRRAVRLPVNRFWGTWEAPDGTRRLAQMTEAEYRWLGAGPGRRDPARPAELATYTRIGGFEEWQFDTPNGLLSPGDVTEAFGEPMIILRPRTIRSGLVVIAKRMVPLGQPIPADLTTLAVSTPDMTIAAGAVYVNG